MQKPDYSYTVMILTLWWYTVYLGGNPFLCKNKYDVWHSRSLGISKVEALYPGSNEAVELDFSRASVVLFFFHFSHVVKPRLWVLCSAPAHTDSVFVAGSWGKWLPLIGNSSFPLSSYFLCVFCKFEFVLFRLLLQSLLTKYSPETMEQKISAERRQHILSYYY